MKINRDKIRMLIKKNGKTIYFYKFDYLNNKQTKMNIYNRIETYKIKAINFSKKI